MKRLLSALAAVAVVCALAPGAASATGTSTIDLGGKAVKSLRSQGVEIAGYGGASARRKRVVLRVRSGLVSSRALLNQSGGVVLRRRVDGRRRELELGRLQVRLGRTSEIVGQVGPRRLTIFRLTAVSRTLSLDSRNGSAAVRGASVSLTRAAGRLIKKRLRLRRLPSGAFGKLTLEALVTGSDAPLGDGPGGGGPGGGGPPVSGPIGDEPPVLARPASAVNVTDAQITWHVRPSLIRYLPVNAPFAGAWGDPPTTTPLCGESNEAEAEDVYSFHFPFAHGWYDPPTKTAATYFTGGVNFKFQAHGIDLDTKDPEIELNGANSRAIARFDGRLDTKPGNKRGVMVDLNLPVVTPAETPGSVSYERIPAAVPAGGAESVFAGFYVPGDTFGCISVSFNYPAGP